MASRKRRPEKTHLRPGDDDADASPGSVQLCIAIMFVASCGLKSKARQARSGSVAIREYLQTCDVRASLAIHKVTGKERHTH